MKKYFGLEQISTVIPKGIKALGRKFERDYRCRYAVHHWQEIVGSNVAKHAKAVNIEKNVLFVYAPDSTWRNELMMFSDSIIQKTNDFVGEKIAKEIHFVNRPQYMANSAILKKTTKKNIAKTGKVKLTDDEKQAIKNVCQTVTDKELRQKLQKLLRSQKELKHKRESAAWQKCQICGTLCPPGSRICFRCRTARLNERRRLIRNYLNENPWARYAEINEFVKCEPQDVNDERTIMVQRWAGKITINDREKLLAKKLVMLYRCLPPEQLTDDIVNETLYTLRNNLAKTAEFKPIKRYVALKKRHTAD